MPIIHMSPSLSREEIKKAYIRAIEHVVKGEIDPDEAHSWFCKYTNQNRSFHDFMTSILRCTQAYRMPIRA